MAPPIVRGALAAAAALLVAASGASAQGAGRITGVVTDAESKAPVPSANVVVAGTTRGATTGPDGRYTIANVTAGVVTVEVRRVGFGQGRVENVRVPEGGVATVNVELRTAPLRLESVVVSGTVDPTSGLKAPITVAKLTADDIPLPPATSAAGAIQGKVAGARIQQAGGPGSGVYIQLRSPTSQFKSTSPMYVVDGVILSSVIAGATTSDIEVGDIESIEVIKGAAAASLYGSRAANGVISITTKRGRGLAEGTTQITARSEYGFNQFARFPSKRTHHQFRVNETGQYVNAAGTVVERDDRVLSPLGIADQSYIDPVYDHASQFLDAGQFNTVNLSVAQNTAATNWTASYNRYREGGVVTGSFGYLRQNFRVNLDHRMGEKISIQANAYHSRAKEDPPAVSWSELYGIEPDVNLLAAPEVSGMPYVIVADPLDGSVNPLHRQYFNDDVTTRARTLLSSRVTYRPISWLNLDANLSYDRGDVSNTEFIERGALTTSLDNPSLGRMERWHDVVNNLNGDVGATVINAFGDLTSRVTARGLFEREENPYFYALGTQFSVGGVKDLDVAQNKTISSSYTDRRAASYMASWAVDYAGKYIGDLVVRRDGSSLFGPENRWNTFYRGSAAYRMAEENWWPVPVVNEFKLRYSIGQGGTRPGFSDQYENLGISTGGGITRQSLGNAALRAEVATEQEVAIDAIIANRYSISLGYAQQVSRHNIISVPVPALTGFNTQERNVGSVSGNTLELTVQAQVIRNPAFQWEVNLVADRTRSKREEFNRSCYGDGILYHCDGSNLGDMWGYSFVRDASQLPAAHSGSQAAFQRNDDGYLVAVGAGGDWRNGVSQNLWGTKVTVDGVEYDWGMPILQRDEAGQLFFGRIGDMNPDVNFGIGNTFRWRGIQLYGLFTGQVGGDMYNLAKRTRYANATAGETDQFGKADELKKPVRYYSVVLASPSSYNSHFVEKATYLKLSELQLRYTLPQSAMRFAGRVGASRIALELNGRNLFTWTGYSGTDPEAGSPFYRVESSSYPLYRTITGGVNVTF